MSQFPLYNSLSLNLPEKDITQSQKNDMIKKISNMDSETHELIYVLIKSFYNDNTVKNNNIQIPYNGVLEKEKLHFDISYFPNKLKQLLHKFITLHSKKILEDEKIKEIQKQ